MTDNALISVNLSNESFRFEAAIAEAEKRLREKGL